MTASPSDLDANREQLAALRTWFDSPVGRQLIETEQRILDQLLPGFFGYHLLQLGISNHPLWEKSCIGHRFRMGLTLEEPGDVMGPIDHLPFDKDSVDVVILQHALELFESPHPILRETARIVIPSGYVVIIGFNPLSLWGLWKSLPLVSRHPPANVNRILPGRLMDWLGLLDFKIDRVVYGFYQLPVFRSRRLRLPDFSQGLSRRMNWPFGGLFVVVARKQVGSLIPLRPSWRTSTLRPINAIQPVNREGHDGLNRRNLH